MTVAMTPIVLVALALSAPAQAGEVNPIGKVLQLLSGLEAKITKEGDDAEKTHNEYSEWCQDRSANVGFEIKTGKSDVENLQATIQKQTSLISSFSTKVDDLTASISSDEADLNAATAIRSKELASFEAEDKELTEVIDTLARAINILSREMQKGGASMVQLKNAGSVAKALGIMVQASAVSSADASRLTAFVQSTQESDDADAGAPDAAVYESKSGGIVEVLQGLEDKAVEQLADARKKEATALHNFQMMAQSLQDEIKYANKDLSEAKKGIAASAEAKAVADGDLTVTSKDLEADIVQLQDLHQDCATRAEDFASAKQSRGEELKALADAKKVIAEATGAAEKLAYGLDQVSFLQRSRLSSSSDLSHFEAVRLLRDLASKQHSPVLEQLASQIVSAFRLGAKTGEDPFAKVKGLISDMVARLEDQAGLEMSHKAYCDKELRESKAKQYEKNALVEKLSTSIDQMASKSAQLKEQVAALQRALAHSASSQAEMEKLRQQEHAEFVPNKADMEQGIAGVQTALKILSDYYANDGKTHAAAAGSGNGIVGLLEVCLSDFSKGLAEMVTTEDSAQESFERASRENKLETSVKDQDVKYKSAESVRLEKAVAEVTSDRSAAQDQLDAVLEYLEKLKEQCVAKAESYSERKARRDAELAGLRRALDILEGQAMLLQRFALRGVRPHVAL